MYDKPDIGTLYVRSSRLCSNHRHRLYFNDVEPDKGWSYSVLPMEKWPLIERLLKIFQVT